MLLDIGTKRDAGVSVSEATMVTWSLAAKQRQGKHGGPNA